MARSFGIAGVKNMAVLALAFGGASCRPDQAPARENPPAPEGSAYLLVMPGKTGEATPVSGSVHVFRQGVIYTEFPSGDSRVPPVSGNSYIQVYGNKRQAVTVRCKVSCPSEKPDECFDGRALDEVIIASEQFRETRLLTLEFVNADTLRPESISIGPRTQCAIYLGDKDWKPPER